MTTIAVRTLTKSYGSGSDRLTALDNVSFEVNTGEFLSIIGPSGCGKTTLLKIIAGLLSYEGGEVIVEGKVLTGATKGMAFIFQNPALLPWRRVLGNVLLSTEISGQSHDLAEQQAREMIRLVGLNGAENKFPHELSRGMQSRVALCRAMLPKPRLLLMDEPFASLDALTRERLDSELRKIWTATRFTAVFVTHNIAEAVYLSERVLVMTKRPGHVRDIVRVDLNGERSWGQLDGPPGASYLGEIRRALASAMNESPN